MIPLTNTKISLVKNIVLMNRGKTYDTRAAAALK
jgi:hypothetical protein